MDSFVDDIAQCFRSKGRDGRRECISLAESYGLEHIGTGKGREVFTDGEVALKTVRHGGNIGPRENKNGVEWSSEVEGTIAGEYFATVHKYGDNYNWLIMDYYPEDLDSPKKVDEVKTRVQDLDIECWDLFPENFSQNKNGTVAIIDYGQGCYWD